MKTFLLPLAAAILCSLAAYAEPTTLFSNFCGPFDKLEVTDNVNVVYRTDPDSAGYMRYEGGRRFADAFIVSNKNGKLKIQVNTEDVNDPELPTIHIFSNFLTSVENSSEKRIEIRSLAAVPSLTVKQIGNGSIAIDGIRADRLKASIATGNGQIILTGSATEANFIMVGTGTIQADLLRADVVKCSVVGGGTIGCWPQESIRVKGLGSTKVYYRGNPVVKKGPGLKVMCLDTMKSSEDSAGETSGEVVPSEPAEEEEESAVEEEEQEEEEEEESGEEDPEPDEIPAEE